MAISAPGHEPNYSIRYYAIFGFANFVAHDKLKGLFQVLQRKNSIYL